MIRHQVSLLRVFFNCLFIGALAVASSAIAIGLAVAFIHFVVRVARFAWGVS